MWKMNTININSLKVFIVSIRLCCSSKSKGGFTDSQPLGLLPSRAGAMPPASLGHGYSNSHCSTDLWDPEHTSCLPDGAEWVFTLPSCLLQLSPAELGVLDSPGPCTSVVLMSGRTDSDWCHLGTTPQYLNSFPRRLAAPVLLTGPDSM